MELLQVITVAVFAHVISASEANGELPADLRDPVLFCEGCYGVMYEIDALMLKLKHLKLNQRVVQSMNEVCSNEHLRKYVFSPPKMTKVCKAMVGHFRDDLKMFLLDKYQQGKVLEDPYELVKEFCIDRGTKSCSNESIPSLVRKMRETQKLKEDKAEL